MERIYKVLAPLACLYEKDDLPEGALAMDPRCVGGDDYVLLGSTDDGQTWREFVTAIEDAGDCVEVPKECAPGEECNPATGVCEAPPSAGSCVGRCGNLDLSLPCQCDRFCTSQNDCCPDAYDVCDSSCMGNCGFTADVCFCDSTCSVAGDCCPDVDAECGG